MFLGDLVVEMVIRRPEQLTRNATSIDDLIIPFGRIHLHFGRIKKHSEVMAHDMVDDHFFTFERQPIWHRNIQRFLNGLVLRGFMRQYGNETIILRDHGAGNFE